jgi:hypothetical protein
MAKPTNNGENNKLISVKVPNTAIYSLSNGSNDLKKFKPFVIKLQ